MTEYLYTVCFTGDHFTLTTCVNASTKKRAEQYAKLLLLDHHGIDVEDIGVWDTLIETDGAYA